MLPSNPSSSLNPYYWSPSHIPQRRFRELPMKSDIGNTPSVEPCYFYESQNGVAYLDVELPGVKKRNINVEVNGNNLCITGKRFRIDRDAQQAQQMQESETSQNSDLSFVYFLQMRLGSDADAEHISARCYEDGILTLAIPIKPSLVTRKIPIELE